MFLKDFRVHGHAVILFSILFSEFSTNTYNCVSNNTIEISNNSITSKISPETLCSQCHSLPITELVYVSGVIFQNEIKIESDSM